MKLNPFQFAHEILVQLEAQGFRAMLAGGCVRDMVMGIEPKDFDIATTALPEQALKTLEAKGYRVIPTGIKHGTITVLHAKHRNSVEVTTLRLDVKTDGRHAEVSFEDVDFATDAGRRDFTINALFQDSAGKIHDFVGGKKDLEARVLRFVGDPSRRIREDFLRILRFFRFWARLDFSPDFDALTAIRQLRMGLKQVSQERVSAELMELLSYRKISTVLQSMFDTGVAEQILHPLQEGRQKWQPILSRSENAHKTPYLSRMRLASMLATRFNAKDAETWLRELKVSNRDQRLMIFLVQQKPLTDWRDQAEVFDFVDKLEALSETGAFARALYQYWTWQDDASAALIERALKLEQQKSALRLQALPIETAAVMQILHLPPGPNLGKVLASLKRAFRNEEWATEKDGVHWLKKERYRLLSGKT